MFFFLLFRFHFIFKSCFFFFFILFCLFFNNCFFLFFYLVLIFSSVLFLLGFVCTFKFLNVPLLCSYFFIFSHSTLIYLHSSQFLIYFLIYCRYLPQVDFRHCFQNPFFFLYTFLEFSFRFPSCLSLKKQTYSVLHISLTVHISYFLSISIYSFIKKFHANALKYRKTPK